MSSNPKNNLLTIHMRKTKKRVTAATKLHALTRGKQIRSQQKRQNSAVTKLQALARGSQSRPSTAQGATHWIQHDHGRHGPVSSVNGYEYKNSDHLLATLPRAHVGTRPY